MKSYDDINPFKFSNTPTEEEIKIIKGKLDDHNREQTKGEYDQHGFEINLVLKDAGGNVVGGIIASTMFRVMHLEVLWVANEYRKLGYGRELVLAAERIGFEKGCMASQTWTFEFQAPVFYQKIGYELVGVYDGYPDGLKEYVLAKRLGDHQVHPDWTRASMKIDSNGLYITENISEEDLKTVHAGLRKHVDQFVGDEKNGIGIRLVIRDQADKIIGGLLAWTTIRNMLIENIWIEDKYRNLGLGKKLMVEAESMAIESGCIASLTYGLSFQAPEFFLKQGYQVFGFSDGYPSPVREFYFIKKFSETAQP
ncbi:MAG: GNAT family N-acetyltransferase [Anaerolineales bacterium]|nr:GNAT family N-acetyltransferase [Anaerolineales bacterium]